eukprot:jgi/Chrzof1/5943/Cz16g21130.t1
MWCMRKVFHVFCTAVYTGCKVPHHAGVDRRIKHTASLTSLWASSPSHPSVTLLCSSACSAEDTDNAQHVIKRAKTHHSSNDGLHPKPCATVSQQQQHKQQHKHSSIDAATPASPLHHTAVHPCNSHNPQHPPSSTALQPASGAAADLCGLQTLLQYTFQSPHLLRQACTHADNKAALSYHQLAFVGDAALYMLFADCAYSQAQSGDVKSIHTSIDHLISRHSCAATARAWGLQRYLRTQWHGTATTNTATTSSLLPSTSSASASASSSSSSAAAAAAAALRHDWSKDVMAEMFEGVIGALLLDSDYINLKRVLGFWAGAALAVEQLMCSSCSSSSSSLMGGSSLHTSHSWTDSGGSHSSSVSTANGLVLITTPGSLPVSFSLQRTTGDCQQHASTSKPITSSSDGSTNTAAASNISHMNHQSGLSNTAPNADVINNSMMDSSNISSNTYRSSSNSSSSNNHHSSSNSMSAMFDTVASNGHAGDTPAAVTVPSVMLNTASHDTTMQAALAQHVSQCIWKLTGYTLSLDDATAMQSAALLLQALHGVESRQQLMLQMLGYAVSKLAAAEHVYDQYGQRVMCDGDSSIKVLTAHFSGWMTVRRRCRMAVALGIHPEDWCQTVSGSSSRTGDSSSSSFLQLRWKQQKVIMSHVLDVVMAVVYLHGGMAVASQSWRALVAATPLDPNWSPGWANKNYAAWKLKYGHHASVAARTASTHQ